MEFKQSSTESAISDICKLFGIAKLSPFRYDQIKDIIINVQRNGKYDGVVNHNNWIAETNPHTQIRSLTINKKKIENRTSN